MKLFLSSENVGRYSDKFVELCGPSKSVLYIGNAGDYKDPTAHTAKKAEHKAQFEGLGLSFTELDLRDYFNQSIPENILDEHDMIWCSGGNTFLLRAACLYSGFDTLLVSKVQAGEIAYGGSSAGAILAGPTLQGAQYGDAPELVKSTYGFDIEWGGLNLTQFVCVPHCESDWFGKEATMMIHALKENDVPYIALKDGQVFLVNNDDGKILV